MAQILGLRLVSTTGLPVQHLDIYSARHLVQ
jgi:hypothetical protein